MNPTPKQSKKSTAKGKRYISVRPVKLAEPNWDSFAQALFKFAAADLAAKQKKSAKK